MLWVFTFDLTQKKIRFTRFAYSRVPVVITDAMVNWTAPEVFSFEYFKQLYNQDSNYRKNCQFFPYKTKFRSLMEVFEMDPLLADYSEGKPWYIGWYVGH